MTQRLKPRDSYIFIKDIIVILQFCRNIYYHLRIPKSFKILPRPFLIKDTVAIFEVCLNSRVFSIKDDMIISILTKLIIGLRILFLKFDKTLKRPWYP